MRIFYQILIIIFIFSSFFVIKEDVVSVLNNIDSSLTTIESSLEKNIKTQVTKLAEKENILPTKIDIVIPGALRAVDTILNINNTDLSKDGVILLTNKYRKEDASLPALKENNKLNASAENKLKDMFANQYFEHISKKGLGVGDLGEEVSYEYILIGENLAMGNFKDDQALVDAWVASKGHRENIVNKNYTEIGVAVGKGRFEGRDIWMAVSHFGTPVNICPSVDNALHEVVLLNQNKIAEMEGDLSIRLEIMNKGMIYEGKTHNEQVIVYNDLVDVYNNLIKDTKEKINDYNNQIKVFNTCLSTHQ